MRPQPANRPRRWPKRLLGALAVCCLFVFLLELFYRYQWIDTYRREIRALNPDLGRPDPRKKVLVMGDSFSAAPNSWVNVLRDRHPDLQFVNSAVPGTTILQANIMLPGRLDEFRPDLLVYQAYVGNDLFDLRYPVNWGEVGFFRNLYWSAANHLRSLAWVNYALGQLKRSADMPDLLPEKDNQGAFDPARYAPREKLYLQAEPGLVADQALLLGDRAADMEGYLDQMREFVATADAAGVPVLVLVVPHCAQVHPRYAARVAQLGATGVETPGLQAADYAFWNSLSTLQSSQVTFVSLLPDLRDLEECGMPAYYLHDPHLNEDGQAVVADAVEQALGASYFGR